MSEPAVRTKDNLLALRKDAAQMVQDLSELTGKLAETGKDFTGEIKDDLVQQLDKQLQELSTRMKSLGDEVKADSQKVDQHLREHPYGYILGAVGLGFLLGKIRKLSKE
jgi:ElaB/YqjD/DUF883 family membrane-anchored ribosome-binding protein